MIDRSQLLKMVLLSVLSVSANALAQQHSETVALWLFDEQLGLYPSCHLSDASENNYSLVLGRGGAIVEGRFGHALQPVEPVPMEITASGKKVFGLTGLEEVPEQRAAPLNWGNAFFCAFFTVGEKDLRKRDFTNPTQTGLNLGDTDWTFEFWFKSARPINEEGVVFEIGEGPRARNDHVTRLSLSPSHGGFFLENQPGNVGLAIPSDLAALGKGEWLHLAFCYASGDGKVHHWLNGMPQPEMKPTRLKPLSIGEDAYFTVGRDGLWERPLPGAVDEMRITRGCLYQGEFIPPASFSRVYGGDHKLPRLQQGPPLLFWGWDKVGGEPIALEDRRHLFIDDALIESSTGIEWTVNPPVRRDITETFLNGHLSVVDDEEGTIRIYGQGPKDSLAVITSKDGLHFEVPDLGYGEYHGARNVVIRDAVGLGQVFMDPNAPTEERWRYLSGIRNQAVYVYTSPDGWIFRRNETSALPFSAGSQSNIYYDDQRQTYVAFHRSDYGRTPFGKTERRFVRTEVQDLLAPWPFSPTTPERTAEVAKSIRIKNQTTDPWFVDNGPLAPGGFGIEYPIAFSPDPQLDPIPTDIYVPKVIKYPWAPDTYLAFPHFYFHYWVSGSETREILGTPERNRGSGVVEIQFMSSRDGLSWKRFPRPAYVGCGHDRDTGEFHMARMVQGMVRRGEEIWQFHTTHPEYHSAWTKPERTSSGPTSRIGKPALFRMVQRLDGFVSADSLYTGGEMVTHPLVFKGNRLVLNIGTEATGYAQVGILDEDGNSIPGYSVDDCIFINGDFTRTEVEWLDKGFDVGSLAGQPIKLRFRMRGSKLYSMQFTGS